MPRARSWVHRALAAGLVAAGAASLAAAGQVRIDVGDHFYAPRAVNLNQGDHAVWVWTGTVGHNGVSGDSATAGGDGVFSSGFPVLSARFSWKTDRLGHLPYFCEPHVPDMAGRLIVAPGTAIPVSDFRITEVQYNRAGGQDLIEIANLGAAAGDLGRYRLAISASGTGVEIPLHFVPVPSGGRITLHANASGANTATDVFLPALPDLPDVSGALALYAPHNRSGFGVIGSSNSLADATMILDFVQWGAGAQANEPTAVAAGFWGAGTFIPTVAAGHAIEFCGTAGQYGALRWAEVSTPNFGTDGQCLTPTLPSTWGRLKTLYR